MIRLELLLLVVLALVVYKLSEKFQYTSPVYSQPKTSKQILEWMYKEGLIDSPSMDSIKRIEKVNPGWGWKLNALIQLARMRGNFTEEDWNYIFSHWNDSTYSDLVSLLQDRWMAPSIKNLI